MTQNIDLHTAFELWLEHQKLHTADFDGISDPNLPGTPQGSWVEIRDIHEAGAYLMNEEFVENPTEVKLIKIIGVLETWRHTNVVMIVYWEWDRLLDRWGDNLSFNTTNELTYLFMEIKINR